MNGFHCSLLVVTCARCMTHTELGMFNFGVQVQNAAQLHLIEQAKPILTSTIFSVRLKLLSLSGLIPEDTVSTI